MGWRPVETGIASTPGIEKNPMSGKYVGTKNSQYLQILKCMRDKMFT